MRLNSALAAVALVLGVVVSACGSTATPTAEVVASGECPREKALVRRALDRSSLRTDVNGDGRLDTVATASQPRASKPCRAFVGVRVAGGSTYSTHLFPEAAPLKGLRAQVVGLPRLGGRPGAEIVVDTRAAVDALLAQMFTLVDGRLRLVQVPTSRDGTFIVAGGGVVYPRAAACTADGDMVFSEAAQTRDGKRFRVVRRTYTAGNHRIRLADPVVARDTVRIDRLIDRFPEFGPGQWKACTGVVRR